LLLVLIGFGKRLRGLSRPLRFHGDTTFHSLEKGYGEGKKTQHIKASMLEDTQDLVIILHMWLTWIALRYILVYTTIQKFGVSKIITVFERK